MVNLLLIPTAEQIRELRKIFFEKLDNEGAPSTCVDGFHPKDIDRVQNVDVWLQRFLEQNDLDMKASLKQLWETCEWRRTYGTNDINESNINMDYVNVGDCFPRNHDIEGKMMLIYRSALHVKGKRDTKELIRIFVYWIERMYRKNNFEPITIFFDLANCGLKNLDMDYTINVVNILKSYYPNAANYILIYEMPWVFAAGIKLIKSLLPPKAVATMKFIDSKNITEYISYECMQRSWGGVDDYTFQFEPETVVTKQVHFANYSPPESPMGDQLGNNSFSDRSDGAMLQIKPSESIIFTNSGNELVGTVEIINIIQSPVTYKIKTTSPEKFRVRPSTGILAPGANALINVVLQHGHQMPVLTKDKFLVMCMELASDASTTSHDIAELWKNMSTNSSQVEQHRLKCWTPSSVQSPGDSSKNGILYSNSLEGDHRSVSHFSSSTVTQQLVTVTNRLESQMKFQQTLQWITLIVILLLSVAIVYILKMEIKNANGEYCTSMHRN